MSTRSFLAAWLRNPKQMGAIVPSGMPLARAMAAQVPGNAQTVIELGPGTGAITCALVSQRIPGQRLMLVEKEPAMVAGLGHRFPDTEILHGDAAHLQRLLRARQIPSVDVVVSSLPLLAISKLTAARILRQAVAVLAPGGVFIQFTYSPAAPVDRRLADRLKLEGTRVAVIVRNLPPASVWVYRRQTPTTVALGMDGPESAGVTSGSVAAGND